MATTGRAEKQHRKKAEETIRIDIKGQTLLKLVRPHIDSFDFFLREGLDLLVRDLQPVKFVLKTSESRQSVTGDANAALAETNSSNQKSEPSKPTRKVQSTENSSAILLPFKDSQDKGSFDKRIEVSIVNLEIKKPIQSQSGRRKVSDKLLPRQCRESQTSYKAPLYLTISCKLNDKECHRLVRLVGEVPVMVGSCCCYLAGLCSEDLKRLGEEEYETGGYFICNGVEKVVRMVIVPRRNHIMAVKRESNVNRGPLFSPFSCYMRCVKADQTSKTLHLHYLTSGAIQARISIYKQEYVIPVLLLFKALVPETTDRTIYELIMQGDDNDIYLRDRVIAMMMDGVSKFDGTPGTELVHLGKYFRVIMNLLDQQLSDEEAGKIFLKQYILVHLSGDSQSEDDNQAKIEILALMIRKLIALARGAIAPDNPDSLAHQEVLLPGHLYMIDSKGFSDEEISSFRGRPYFATCLQRCPVDIGRRMENFIATGQLQTRTGLDLMQVSGYAVVAERISYFRYISHFRCIHRGQFFSELKTTSVRKLLPEAWGFLCPVHTPDGAPCGLVNHLAHPVIVSQSREYNVQSLFDWLVAHGMTMSYTYSSLDCPTSEELPVVMDGRLLGYVPITNVTAIGQHLRLLKSSNDSSILPKNAEIFLVTKQAWNESCFPGIYIYTGPARLLRPVRSLLTKDPLEEYIGTLEQTCLRITNPKVETLDSKDDTSPLVVATHEEKDPMGFLSLVASLIPFSDMNQSPRNMYQCQMSKQSLGTPYQLFERRSDTKMYRLTTPQVPIVRNLIPQNSFEMDNFPNGFNAVVAVLSYTGYDMEDAMVINKGSLERGLAYGTVYTTQLIDLDQMRGTKSKYIGGGKNKGVIGEDGLPEVGMKVFQGDPLYCIVDETVYNIASGSSEKLHLYKQADAAIVDQVRIIPQASKSTNEGMRRASIKLRHPRVPVIGDKFASRHGQKGVLSSLWPSEDMPFTENGIVPDIIFNPNGFPSRMTIGMMMESICGKAGALHGIFQVRLFNGILKILTEHFGKDSTPFRFDENHTAVDYFGEQLRKAGFNFYGNEMMYSGYTGEPFQVDIFIGVIHYQRLRHMVSDKFQVRSTGPINPLTRQPVKGRKVGGAIRFGEMERDALLAHGAASLLQDRLQISSDLHTVYVCENCGSILALQNVAWYASHIRSQRIVCRACGEQNGKPRKILLPYVFKYLATELAAVNIQTCLSIASEED
eukprot:jgi/Galph1/5963/GphlegSOOS_G4623.1